MVFFSIIVQILITSFRKGENQRRRGFQVIDVGEDFHYRVKETRGERSTFALIGNTFFFIKFAERFSVHSAHMYNRATKKQYD